MFVHYGLKPFRSLLATLVTPETHHSFSRLGSESPPAVVPGWWSWCWDHDLLPHRAPHRPPGGEPTPVALISGGEDVSRLSPITGLFNRLVFPAEWQFSHESLSFQSGERAHRICAKTERLRATFLAQLELHTQLAPAEIIARGGVPQPRRSAVC